MIFNAILLGLLAGIFEETARYILFKYILKKSHSWNDGIVVGIGHGGIEAILLGIIAVSTTINMIVLRNTTDFSALGIPAGQIELVKTQVQAYWSQPEVMPLFGLFERLSSMGLHIALSVVVLYSVVSGQRKWFWFAVLWHALVDATAVYLFPKANVGANMVLGVISLELLVAALCAGALVYAIRLRVKFPVENETLENTK